MSETQCENECIESMEKRESIEISQYECNRLIENSEYFRKVSLYEISILRPLLAPRIPGLYTVDVKTILEVILRKRPVFALRTMSWQKVYYAADFLECDDLHRSLAKSAERPQVREMIIALVHQYGTSNCKVQIYLEYYRITFCSIQITAITLLDRQNKLNKARFVHHEIKRSRAEDKYWQRQTLHVFAHFAQKNSTNMI